MSWIRTLAFVVAAAGAGSGLLAQQRTGGASAAKDRIGVAQITGRPTAVLRGSLNPALVNGTDLGPADPAMQLSLATLDFQMTGSQQADLAKLLEDQRTPGSADYRRWLTPEEFGNRFGLSSADAAKVRAWLQAQGFHIEATGRARRWVSFSGTVRQAQQAFRTEIHRYSVDGVEHFANASAPAVPQQLDGVVAGIRGLDDFEPAPAMGKRQFTPVIAGHPNYTSGSGAHYLAPEDVALIYNAKQLYSGGYDGSGQKIAILGRTDVSLTDIRLFRARFGLPANDPQMMLFGTDPGTSQGDVTEADLDLEWSGALAPKAQIIYVYSRSTYTSAQYAVDQNIAPVMSLSYGGCEEATSSATLDFLRGVAQQANAQGITWVVSTGDTGAAGCERQAVLNQASKGLGVQSPASIPEITAVGGTEFAEGSGKYWNNTNDSVGGSALGYIPEMAWNDSGLLDGLASSTGGPSAFFAKPAWQTGPGVPNDGARDIPDVSLAASWNHDGWLLYYSGALYIAGGTSVSTPAFAGMLALVNQYLTMNGTLAQPGLGNINPVLYRMAQTTSDVFHDITMGDNIVTCLQGSPNCVNGTFGFAAGPGYDLATGLGSVNAANLAMEWNAGAASTTSASADPATVAYDGTVNLNATVSGGSGTPTGTVSFVVNDLAIGSATLAPAGAAANATLTVNASVFPSTNTTVTALYSGDGNYGGSSTTTSVMLTYPAGGSAVSLTISPNPIRLQNSSSGQAYFYTVTLTEKAGVGTTITGLTVLGKDLSSQIRSYFGTNLLPARGTLTANISSTAANPPATGTVSVSGMDPSGRKWTAQASAQFLADVMLAPSISLTTTSAIAQTGSADCAYSEQLNLQENGGYEVDLTRLTAGSTNFTSQLQQIFGTVHLAPFGLLQGTVCFSAAPPAGLFYQLTGTTTELSSTVTASATAAPVAGKANEADFNVTPAVVESRVSDAAGSADATVMVNVGSSTKWTAAVEPLNILTSWLTITPSSGTGPGSVMLHLSASGLSTGVYRAVVTVRAATTPAQFMNVQVAFAVGAGGATIGAAVNAASFDTVAAPGAILSAFGTNLAPAAQVASSLPLPYSMQGVSATVNGIYAPLYYVGPGQVNLQVPYETSAGMAVLGINNNGNVASFVFPVTAAEPGIFGDANRTLVPSNTGKAGQVLLAFITGEGDVSPNLFTGRTPLASTPVASLPAPLLPVSVTVGGVAAMVNFAGTPAGLAGVTQINFVVPAGVTPGNQPVIVTVGGVSSAPVTLNVTQ